MQFLVDYITTNYPFSLFLQVPVYQNCFHSKISIFNLTMVSVMSFFLSLTFFSNLSPLLFVFVDSQNSADALLLPFLLMNSALLIP